MNQTRNINKVIDALLIDFTPKQRKVLEGRFGLRGERQTLQQIGDGLGVTRERIRQIEAQSLDKLKTRVAEEAQWLVDHANNFLEQVGNVRRDDYFMQDVRHVAGIDDTAHVNNKVRFILLITDTPPYLHKETDELESFWYTDDKARREIQKFLEGVIAFFNKHDKEEILEEKIHLKELGDVASHHHVAISKLFGVNSFGDFGLKEWPEIKPKVIRDKAYLVLKKHGEPLHFADIAKLIYKHGLDTKRTHTQTVHNELIKDVRFVLVGRGMYALQEHGFEGGTVREVIDRILREQGPLEPEAVIDLVNKRKILQRNTILLNLQNRNHFHRQGDGRYVVKNT